MPKRSSSSVTPSKERRPDRTTKEYIDKYATLAQACQRKYGVPASISIAQGILESACGTSAIAKLTNNHFGVTCSGNVCSRDTLENHCMKFRDGFFRVYRSDKGSWLHHARIISHGQYEWLTEMGSDYRAWAHGLKDSGYAQDAGYAGKLIKIIEAYGLHRYDLKP